MLIQDVMTRNARTVGPEENLRTAAELMRLHDIGFLPVCQNGRVVGAITDRDMVVRGLAAGMNADALVRTVMSEQVVYAFDDEDITEGLRRMQDEGVRRLLVLSRKMDLVGVVSLDDLASVPEQAPAVVETLAELS